MVLAAAVVAGSSLLSSSSCVAAAAAMTSAAAAAETEAVAAASTQLSLLRGSLGGLAVFLPSLEGAFDNMRAIETIAPTGQRLL